MSKITGDISIHTIVSLYLPALYGFKTNMVVDPYMGAYLWMTPGLYYYPMMMPIGV